MDPVRAISLSGSCVFAIGAILRYTTRDSAYDLLMIIPVIAIGAALALGPQLRWRYWMKHAPDLPGEAAGLMDRFDLYRRLGLKGKREFRRRTFLLRERFHINGEAIETIPEDVQMMVAASAATVGFHRDDFLLGDYETVVFYRHYFPTPVHEVLHASELHPGDGAIIWTFSAFVRSCVEPRKFLHLGLYEYGRAMLNLEPELKAKLDGLAFDYARIQKISGFPEEKLKEFVGLPDLDLTAITLVLYFTHRDEMATLFGETLAAMDALLVKNIEA